jgi:ribosome-binding factor A
VNPRRRERLAEEIRTVVAELVARKLKDPRIGFVTVTRAEVTPDVGLARVYVSVLGEEAQRKASLEGLAQAAGFVRRELGRRLRLRQTPEVTFSYDRGIEATDRIARLLDATAAAATEQEPDEGEGGSDA